MTGLNLQDEIDRRKQRALAAASICDCEQAHNGLGISGRECDCQADDERCTGCYGTGWDSNAERFCHCEDGANAALAPSGPL